MGSSKNTKLSNWGQSRPFFSFYFIPTIYFFSHNVSYELSVIYAAKNKKKKKDITCQHTKNKKEESSCVGFIPCQHGFYFLCGRIFFTCQPIFHVSMGFISCVEESSLHVSQYSMSAWVLFLVWKNLPFYFLYADM